MYIYARILEYVEIHILFRFGFVTDKKFDPYKVYVPKCNYNNEDGIQVAKNDERYCDAKAFQPTFNEYGMCFTFNNRKQGMDEFFRTHQAKDYLENNNGKQNNAQTENTIEKLDNLDNDNPREILKVKSLYIP